MNYDEFQSENSSFGYLKIRTTSLFSAVPISNVFVTVYKIIENKKVVFFQGETDDSGVIESISLPAPKSMQFGSLEMPDYSIYQIDASKENFERVLGYSVGIYSDIKVLQEIFMNPIVNIEQ